MVTTTFQKDGLDTAKAKFSKAAIQIGEGTITNSLPNGEVDAEFTGDFQIREGKVNKPGTPNHDKTWAACIAIFKVKSDKASGKVGVQMDISGIEKLEESKSYKLRVTTNERNPEYKDVRLIEA
jgi:hypothetical protein